MFKMSSLCIMLNLQKVFNNMSDICFNTEPFPIQALVFTCLQYKSFENTVGKGDIAPNEQFLLYPQCFLHVWRTVCHFHQIWYCHHYGRVKNLLFGEGLRSKESWALITLKKNPLKTLWKNEKEPVSRIFQQHFQSYQRQIPWFEPYLNLCLQFGPVYIFVVWYRVNPLPHNSRF